MLRRSHRKSKRGCAHCKRRHIKCDETRPECVNCITAHLSCTFNGGTNSVQTIRFSTERQPRRSTSVASNTASSCESPTLVSDAPQPYLNILHLELLHHFTANMSGNLLAYGTEAAELSPKIVKYAFSFPFLICELLSLSALHLSTSCPERAQYLRDESAKLQTEAICIFNDSVKYICTENVIPAFIYSGVLGLHHVCDTFSPPSQSLDSILDRLVQSIELLRGIREILFGWWDFLLDSDVKALIQQGQEVERHDEIEQRLSELCDGITQSVGLDTAQSKVYETAVKQMSWVYRSRPSLAEINEEHNPWMITTWPILVSAEFVDLLSQRKPESLVVLSYFAVLVHMGRAYWAIRNGGRLLIDAVGAHLGEQWDPWLAWPRSIIYTSS